MEDTLKYITPLIRLLLASESKSVVKYISPKLIIRATRKAYGGKPNKRKAEIILTIGEPNYLEREFIKNCKVAKEPFPIKRMISKPFPKKIK